MNNQLTLGEYISQIFLKEPGQGKLVLSVNMGLSLEQVSLLLADKLELNTSDILRLSNILPISLAEIHSRLLLTEQRRVTRPVGGRKHRDEAILEHQIKHALNYTTNNMYLCDPLIILRMLNNDITEPYSKFGHSIAFGVFLKGHVVHITTQYSVKKGYSGANQFTSMFTPNRSSAEGLFMVVRNERQDMKMNKTNIVIKAWLDGMDTLLSDDQKKEIQEHMEKSLKDKMIKDATETLANAMKATHLREDEEAKVSANVSLDDTLGYMNNRQYASITSIKALVEKQQDMKMNKTNPAIKAFLDRMGILLSGDQKKEILLQENIRAAFKEVNKIKALLENIDAHLENNASKSYEEANTLANASLDDVLGHMSKRLDLFLANLEALVEKRREEEELVNAISKVKALIKEDTIAINKLIDKRVNLTANVSNLTAKLFNLEEKLAKLRNSDKAKS